ncbi:MAG: phosphatase PAP2 family protein [Acidimicrobiales bacterium]
MTQAYGFCFVPAIAALDVDRRWVWWTLTGMTCSVIVLVTWCRVRFGVHWVSDVVGGLAIAFVALSAAEAAIDRQHRPA